MSMQKDSSILEEQFKAILEQAVERVKTEEDPIVISEYKKLFKKYVPFTLRTYVGAFLAKEMASSGFSLSKNFRKSSNRQGRFDSSSRRDSQTENFSRSRFDRSASTRTEREPSNNPRITIDEDKAVTIFIGMGRNRGVYARDVIGLITQRASIDRDRIGEIKVLDNYSFVQVYIEDADSIISLLNGSDYRNRKLAVSYAHKKERTEESGDISRDDSASQE